MHVEVRLFGGLTERAGVGRITVAVPEPATVGALRKAVAAQHPNLAGLLPHVKIAVDLDVADDATVLEGDEQVALLPPVAGGADEQGLPEVRVLTGLVEPPIDVAAAIEQVSDVATGGTAIFLGTVRDHAPDVGQVTGLDYSAYEEMAEGVLQTLAGGLARDHPQLRGIVLLHAIGELAVGDHTVLIVCGAAHREAAFAACRDALERVKTHVPIWKREHTLDGGARWVGMPDTTQDGDA